MPEEKEEKESRETMAKTLRLYADDVDYLIRLLRNGPLSPGACIRDAVHQLVEMCRRNKDRLVYPSVMVPRKDAEECGLVKPQKDLKRD
jgi:hypothetical protein